MATYKLALIIKNTSNDDHFLLIKQTRPPKFNDLEYDSFLDSDLWDLPSTPLTPLEDDEHSQFAVEDQEMCLQKLNLTKFDLKLALDKVLSHVGFGTAGGVQWKFLKLAEEADFGPGFPVQTVYLIGKLAPEDGSLKDHCKWMCYQSCLNLLRDVKPCSDRVGSLVVIGLLNDLMKTEKWKISSTLSFQEYPPGVKIVPMGSKTAKPFHTTNLVIFAPENNHDDYESGTFVAHGDALIIDPGCRSEFNEELRTIISALPRKLIVFVTHHHRDHVDGLSIVQKSNPDATLLVHENTMQRIRKDDWSLGYTSVSGDEDICVGGERLRVVHGPGHTDGHLALLHISTHSLIVGDHCLGQGSALLDVTSGGNMTEYFKTTYKFMELSPHALIPMHGRVNLWPKHMLCGYLKNRRSRESTILKAIENGASSLFDIVAYTYADMDRRLWIPASSNVKLHVDHLAQQDKLPQEFSIEKFKATCGVHFLSRWSWAFLSNRFPVKLYSKRGTASLVGAITVIGTAIVYYVRNKA